MWYLVLSFPHLIHRAGLNLGHLGDGFNLEFTLVLVAFIFDEVLFTLLVLGFNLNVAQIIRSIQVKFELQPTELGFKYPYNLDSSSIEHRFNFNLPCNGLGSITASLTCDSPRAAFKLRKSIAASIPFPTV
ncbi:hypothetical protein C8F04DRAFT_1189333 [Mycena alexandri]|uniref:Uncharacterized protein n=1 Tax=Mycena alexandri TaxID=1745969 RepID=A0AAD6SGM4_9AGAR|nr:hypothetical protein C8F04DRAFT_1189333 [Mycena alexandri]